MPLLAIPWGFLLCYFSVLLFCLRRTLFDVYMIYQESHCWCIGESSTKVPNIKYFAPATQCYHWWLLLYCSLWVLVLSFFVAVPQKVLKKTKFNYGFYHFFKDPFLRYMESRTGQQHKMVTGRGKCGKFTIVLKTKMYECVSFIHVCTFTVK